MTRLDHDANVRPWVIAAERAGATVRLADFDPDTAELTPAHVAAQLSAAHPPGRAHRRVEPVRHPSRPRHDRGPRARRRRAAVRRRRAPDRPRVGRHRRARRRPVRLLAVQVLRPALRRAGGRPGPARAAASRQAGAVQRRRARAVRARHAALRAAWPGRPLRSSSSPASAAPADVTSRADRRVDGSASSSTRTSCASAVEKGVAELPGVTVRSRAARRTPDAAAHLRRPRARRCVPVPRRARGERAGRHLLRL